MLEQRKARVLTGELIRADVLPAPYRRRPFMEELSLLLPEK